jgi:hypothetical protein
MDIQDFLSELQRLPPRKTPRTPGTGFRSGSNPDSEPASTRFGWSESGLTVTFSSVQRNLDASDLKPTVNAVLQKLMFLCLSAFVAGVARGDDLTTIGGRTFHDIQVLSRNSSALLIQSQEGEFQISLTEIKPADRERYSTDLTKAIELPALTVIGEKSDFTAPERSRSEIFAEKEMQRQEQQKQEAQKKRAESYQPIPILWQGVTFSFNLKDPKNDNAVQPSYLTPDYQRLAPEIVEKEVKVFSLSLQNP